MVTATGGPRGDVADRLWESLESYLKLEGVELDDLEVRGRGRGRMVRISVDALGGIGVGRLAELSREMSRLLDDTEPVSGAYTLEVTSPGLERLLRRPSHFEKAIGREVDVKTNEEIDGSKRHCGILEGIGEEHLRLVMDGDTRTIPLRLVAQARTIFRWEKSPKPGGKRGKR